MGLRRATLLLSIIALVHSACHRQNDGLHCDDVYALNNLCPLLNDSITSLHITHSYIYTLDWPCLVNATSLHSLFIRHSQMETVEDWVELPPLRLIDFTGNYLSNLTQLAALATDLPSLETLILRDNYLSASCEDFASPRLEGLDLSGNYLTGPWCSALPESLRFLNLSRNDISEIPPLPPSLYELDLSRNSLHDLGNLSLPALRKLHLSYNSISHLPALSSQLLEELLLADSKLESLPELGSLPRLARLDLSGSRLLWLDTRELVRNSALAHLQLQGSSRLESVQGTLSHLPALRTLNLSDCAISTFPNRFFATGAQALTVDLQGNPLHCSPCRLPWRSFLGSQIRFARNVTCAKPVAGVSALKIPLNGSDSCDFGLLTTLDVISARYYTNATITCPIYGDPAPEVVWWSIAGEDRRLIGSWESGEVFSFQEAGTNVTLQAIILPSSTLLLLNVDRRSTGMLECSAESGSSNASAAIYFHLDYSYWNIHVYIYSLFCGVATALGFFALNVIWAGIRSIVLWRLRQMENTSRLRKMLEALEKYRQRQLEVLQEEYNSRMTQIRDNYNFRSDQLRTSYLSQTERFSNYKAQQLETVQASIETMRDNYNGQLGRVREYGSRQTSGLWESYQRQVNRIRTFSLQQRLRLMRQYKIKQAVLNSLLESLNLDSGFNFKDPEQPGELGLGMGDIAGETLSRASSYHSIAEEFALPPPEEFTTLPSLEELANGTTTPHHTTL